MNEDFEFSDDFIKRLVHHMENGSFNGVSYIENFQYIMGMLNETKKEEPNDETDDYLDRIGA